MVCISTNLLFVLELTWLAYNQVHTSFTAAISRGLCFAKEDPTSFLPLVPKRLTPSGLNGISNPLKCARHSLLAFPESRGFLYNSVTGFCALLLRLENSSSPGAQSVQTHEGDLYLSSGLCGDQFDIMEVGDTGELAWLKYFNTSRVAYSKAASHCSALGAHLVAVKTLPKLDLIKRMVTDDTWVGFEYSTSKGSLTWSKDGENVTAQQASDVFSPGEPNCYYNNEDCGQFVFTLQALNDQVCYLKYHYICEKDLSILVG